MDAQALRAISKMRRVSQADLARMANVSRQAVSNWFQAKPGQEIRVYSSHVRRLAGGLHVSADDLLTPLPVLGDLEMSKRYESELLWDSLYENLLDFMIAVINGEEAALARLVQVFGLYQASKIAGRKVWERFPKYKKLIRPIRREQMERVWQLRQNQMSH